MANSRTMDSGRKPLIENLNSLSNLAPWCLWRFGPMRPDGKRPKLPLNAHSGAVGSATARETFADFETALVALELFGIDGIEVGLGVGLKFAVPDLVAIDVDGCLSDDGTPDDVGADILARFPTTYAEVSPSGHGLRLFLRARKLDGAKQKVIRAGHSVEVYGSGDARYVTVTGHILPGRSGVIEADQASLDDMLESFGFIAFTGGQAPGETVGAKETTPDNAEGSEQHVDDEILQALRNVGKRDRRAKVARLLNGDLGDYGGDASAADMALCTHLAYFTHDPEQIERLWAGTELAKRVKFDDRPDYREATIRKALAIEQGNHWADLKNRDSRRAEAAIEAAALAAKVEALGAVVARDANGRPKSTFDNAVAVLRSDPALAGAAGFNEFAQKEVKLRPWNRIFDVRATSALGDVADDDVSRVRVWLGGAYGIRLPAADVHAAVSLWARDHRYDPVADKLRSLADAWDGTPRLDTWLVDYLHADTSAAFDYVNAVGRKFLIAAVARALRPGCKADNLLVLEGLQGCGKSTAVKLLAEAVCKDAFAESLPALSESEETARALQGVWIAEIAELRSVRRADAEHVKAFLSRREDNVRAPYGKRYEVRRRRCVFVGTTNEDSYIQDASGGRRFWGVKVGMADLQALSRDAGQLWGEAVRAFDRGEAWHLDNPAVLAQAGAEQSKRQTTSWLDDEIASFADGLVEHGESNKRFKLKEIADAVVEDQAERARALNGALGAALRRCGFVAVKSSGRMLWFLGTEAVEAVRRRAA